MNANRLQRDVASSSVFDATNGDPVCWQQHEATDAIYLQEITLGRESCFWFSAIQRVGFPSLRGEPLFKQTTRKRVVVRRLSKLQKPVKIFRLLL